MADTAALVVALSAQLTKFEKDMKGAVDIANRRTKEIEGTFTKMNTNINNQLQSLAGAGFGPLSQLAGAVARLGPLGAAAAAGFAGLSAAFYNVAKSVHQYIEEANKLRDTSDTTGLTISQLKELNKVGLEVGIGADEIDQAITKMTVAIDGLREATGPLYEKLRKVPGVLLEITTAKTAGEAIQALIRHFNSLGDEFEKNAFLKAVFGRGGLKMGRIFKELSDGFKDVKINESLIRQIDDLSDDIARIRDETKDMWGEAFSVATLEFLKTTVEEWRAISAFVLSSARGAKEFFATRPATPSLNAPPGMPQFAVPPRGTTGTTGKPAAPFEAGFTQTGPMPFSAGGSLGVGVPMPTPRPQETLDQRIDALKRWIAVMGDAVPMEKRFQLQELELQKQLETTTVSVQDQEKARTSKSLQTEIDNLQKYITAMGGAAETADKLFLEELKVRKATVDGTLSREAASRAYQDLNNQETIATLTLKERLGVATQAEILQGRELQFLREANQAKLDATAIEQGLTKVRKESKEAYEAQIVSTSKLPGVMRAGLDATFLKQFDQLAVTTMSNFENSLADVAVGTTSLKDAFKSMTDSIIKDLIRMTLRLAVTGPLFQALGAAFGTGGVLPGGAPLGQGGIGHAQHGGPVSAGRPYVVGEHGPELFVPGASGHIVPNAISGGRGGGSMVEINNYVAADTETRQQRQEGPNGERVIIDIVKKAQARGDLDDVNRGRFGLRPAKVR